MTGYLGPNGSGKSTTMKMIAGLLEASVGEIVFHGRPIREDLVGYKRCMGYVAEEPFLYNHLSGMEYLMMVAQLRGLQAQESADRIERLLQLLALHGDRHASISGYSKGMRQKLLNRRCTHRNQVCNATSASESCDRWGGRVTDSPSD